MDYSKYNEVSLKGRIALARKTGVFPSAPSAIGEVSERAPAPPLRHARQAVLLRYFASAVSLAREAVTYARIHYLVVPVM